MEVNTPVSAFEVIGRVINYPSQINKKDIIRNTVFYPRNKRDDANPEYFTNKISMCRLCQTSSTGSIDWDIHHKINEEIFKNKEFKGFLTGRVIEFLMLGGISVEPAASRKNPYHMHLVLTTYKVPYRPDVESVSELIDEDTRKKLDRLRRSCMYVTKDTIANNGHCLCDRCTDKTSDYCIMS